VSNRHDFRSLNPGSFPCATKPQTVHSFNRRKAATSRVVAIYSTACQQGALR
jgi:hypothetical protein